MVALPPSRRRGRAVARGTPAALPLLLLLLDVTGASAATAPGSSQLREPRGTTHSGLAACEWRGLSEAVEHFSEVLRFQTVSHADPGALDLAAFHALDKYLAVTYREVWAALEVERLGEGGLSYLLTWRGSDASLRPVLFISHVDVVPVTQETLPDWQHPPFSGAVADGFIWGRGALDVKCGVVGLLEAATALLREGFAPRRTLMFAFGHDEEVGGSRGAAQIAARLEASGVELEMIWDEGSGILADGVPPFTRAPVALLATSEKSYQTVQVTLSSAGGHSSMPPVDGSTIAGRLGRLLTAVTASPAVPRLVSPTREFLIALGQEARPWVGPLLALAVRVPSLGRLLAGVLASVSGSAAAMVRDTAAVTTIQAGVADNVLPQSGHVAINFRLLPGSTQDDALRLTAAWLGSDAAHANVSLVEPEAFHAAAVTDAAGRHFALVKAAVQAAWTHAASGRPVAVAPWLMPGGTDSKHYRHLSNATLRFTPYSIRLQDKDEQRVHGTNERMRLNDFACLLKTYREGLRAAGSLGP